MLLKRSKVKEVIYTFISVFLLVGCKPSMVSSQDKVESVYKTNIAIVENFIKVGFIEEESTLSNSIVFLEQLTKIKSDFKDQFQMFYTPTIQNLKDWKKWFKENKQKLYWDEKENKVIVR